ncbi:MAG: XRE family transcriptional regulator [Armatimonadetes bacterium]|nr:MAG: XRE family transcriptional regulator [Armatimonadota bacterium]
MLLALLMMHEKPDPAFSTGEPALDGLLGGLLPGDNIVWVGDRPELHDRIESAFLKTAAAPATLVVLSDAPDPQVPPGVEMVDGRSGRPHADLLALEREIIRRGSQPGARIVIRDLDALVRRLGPKAALGFFTRTCPRLFDLGAIAYWRASRPEASPILDGVQRVTQCVVDHTAGRLRVVKAEGRPHAVGRIFDVEAGTKGISLEEVRALGRLADGIRRLRASRGLTQSAIAQLADVSPSAISQVESGQRGLSLDTLLTLGQALNVSIDELIGYQPDQGYILARRDRDPAQRGVIPLLDNPDTGLRAYLVILGAGESGEPHAVHKGAELVLVGTGVVQIVLNEETPVLRAGDALLVTTDAIHGWKNLLPETTRLFWIVRD